MHSLTHSIPHSLTQHSLITITCPLRMQTWLRCSYAQLHCRIQNIPDIHHIHHIKSRINHIQHIQSTMHQIHGIQGINDTHYIKSGVQHQSPHDISTPSPSAHVPCIDPYEIQGHRVHAFCHLKCLHNLIALTLDVVTTTDIAILAA